MNDITKNIHIFALNTGHNLVRLYMVNNSYIDSQMANLLLESLKNACYKTDTLKDFVECKGSWGYRGGKIYLEKVSKYSRALREVAKNSGIMSYQSKLYVFNGKIYEKVEEHNIKFVYNMFIDWLDIPAMILDNKYYQSCFIQIIHVFNRLQPRFDVVAFKNGVLDLNEFKFNKFNPKYHCTYMHPYMYDPNAKCPMWKAFLHEVLPDKASRAILQMFLSLGLTERATVMSESESENPNHVELCLLLVGAGSNGKSVIYNTARGLFGQQRISGADYNELTSLGDEGMRARRLLRGCLFNWSSDSDVRHFGKRTGVFKKIVSGEPITDRAIGGDVEQNFNAPYLIFNLNDLPASNDASLGFVRRLQYISFENIIPKEKQNKHLSKDLEKEYSGIFNWLVRGARELRRRRYVFPDSEGSYRMLLKTMIKSNPVHAWVSAYKVRPCAQANNEISVFIHASVLMESVNSFSELNGGEVVSQQLFGATMGSHGFMKKRRGDGVYYEVFGITENQLRKPFCIEDEELGIQYVHDKKGFIELDD